MWGLFCKIEKSQVSHLCTFLLPSDLADPLDSYLYGQVACSCDFLSKDLPNPNNKPKHEFEFKIKMDL